MVEDGSPGLVLIRHVLQWLRQPRPHPLQHQRGLPQYPASLLAVIEHKPVDAHRMHDIPPASDVARIRLCGVELAEHLHLWRGEGVCFMNKFVNV